MFRKQYLLTSSLGIIASIMIRAAEPSEQQDVPSYLYGAYFEKVTVTATNMLIKFKSSGQGYFYRKSGGPLTKIDYGSILPVAVGESLTIIERHSNITFVPLPDILKLQGFDVTEEIDQRSFGKELKTNRVFMITSEIEGEKDIKDANVTLVKPLILDARVTLKPEALEVSPGILTAFVRLPEGYPVSGITSATCDGAQPERMMPNDDSTEMIIKFRRQDIDKALAQIGETIDTNFLVRGTWQGPAGTYLYQGTDSITKILGAKAK